MELNASIPPLGCLLRAEYAYDLRQGHGEHIPVTVFGLCSIPARALLFHCLTDGGAQIGRLPISAFCWRPEAPAQSVEILQCWDCLSYQVAVTAYEHLRGLRCRTLLKDRASYWGEYLFTADWYGPGPAEDPGEGGWKCGHVLRLDNGNFAVQPNNRVAWLEPACVTKPFALDGRRPDYLTNTHVWRAENGRKWVSSDDDRYFYDLREVNGEAKVG